MNAGTCSRGWQAEAALDQRISAEDRAAFERHAQTCEHCARELRELLRLNELGQQLPWPKVEPLARRRQRNELLRRAHGGDEARPVALAWRRVMVVALLGALVLGVFAYRRLHIVAPVTAVAYEVSAGQGSAWREEARGNAVRLELQNGELSVHVVKLAPGQSFVLRLPDGELEVRGTRFTVAADLDHTQRVSVSEGRVALRLRGRPESVLSAGQSWQLDSVAPEASTRARSSPTSTAVPASSDGERGAKPSRPVTSARVPPVAAGAEPSPSGDFAVAMASFSRGDFATAEQLFERFEAQHPGSSQVEDSLFLRAVARLRRGDGPGARSLAAQYVRRYPSGFRADEAKRIVDAP
jgi:ferric-dicitrate binding protein FerR (iron transport regulator)